MEVGLRKGEEGIEEEGSEGGESGSGSGSRSGIVFLGGFWLMKKSLLIKVSRGVLGELFVGKGARFRRTWSSRPRRF